MKRVDQQIKGTKCHKLYQKNTWSGSPLLSFLFLLMESKKVCTNTVFATDCPWGKRTYKQQGIISRPFQRKRQAQDQQKVLVALKQLAKRHKWDTCLSQIFSTLQKCWNLEYSPQQNDKKGQKIQPFLVANNNAGSRLPSTARAATTWPARSAAAYCDSALFL